MIEVITTTPEEIEQQKQLFDIYCGILFNNINFAPGKKEEIHYHFHCPEYKTLIEKYHIDRIAGEGSAYKRACRLLHWMSPKLKHQADYDNHVGANALALLDYSLDKLENGINCKNKSIVLTECCLALGIYARRVYIFPYSPYDGDNHVTTEIFDPDMDKWIMLDPTTDGFHVDAQGRPLSLVELRDRCARYEYASFTYPKDSSEAGEALWSRHSWTNAYIAKNLFRFVVDGENGFNMADKRPLHIIPQGYNLKESQLQYVEYMLKIRPEFREWALSYREKLCTSPEPERCDVSTLTAKPE